MIGITDSEIAFAFDIECGQILFEAEQEMEMNRFSLLTGASVAQVFSKPKETFREGSF